MISQYEVQGEQDNNKIRLNNEKKYPRFSAALSRRSDVPNEMIIIYGELEMQFPIVQRRVFLT